VALIGYARSSTDDQHPEEVQVPRLVEAGCSKVFCDIGQSGSKASRPEWDKCLAYLREGDVLVSVKLDRWGRSVQHLLQVAADLEARGVGLRCLDQPIDTTTPVGKLVFTILAAVAEFERALIIERTTQGLIAARARGNMGGRPKSYTDQQCQVARMLRDQGEMTAREIAELLSVSRATYFRMVGEPIQREAI
jgi:DNA invertase Pin-like site-specific DNA recombinase